MGLGSVGTLEDVVCMAYSIRESGLYGFRGCAFRLGCLSIEARAIGGEQRTFS